MQVCLLNPPLSVHEFPHLALPMLKTVVSFLDDLIFL